MLLKTGAMFHGTSRRGIQLALVAAFFVGLASGTPEARAVILFGTGDPAHNTQPPSGEVANSGWEHEGTWGSFLGTAIAPQFFITARHVGGTAGDPFVLNGVSYATVALYDDAFSDLRIGRISGAFPSFAALNTNATEVGRSAIVMGRGTQRGEPVTVPSAHALGETTVTLHGWRWGPLDKVRRWGENVVDAVVSSAELTGKDGFGEFLQCRFDSSVGPDECDLSTGDSGGALFIRNGSDWQLAGINYAADGEYNTTGSGEGFFAAIFDEGGLHTLDDTNWVFQPDLQADLPGSFYATRIASRIDWIRSVLDGTAPEEPMVLQSSGEPSGPYRDASADVDNTNRTVSIAIPEGVQFYRLRSPTVRHELTSIEIIDGRVWIRFE